MGIVPLNMFRYAAIIRHIKRERYISMEKLVKEVANDMALSGFEGGFSKRTLQRDLQKIRADLDLSINFSKSEGGYYIPNDEMQDELLESLLEHINLLSALRTVENVSDFVFAEKREAQRMEWVYPLVRAIKSQRMVEFNYRKYTGGSGGRRKVEPYALKEFNGRWYLLSGEPGVPGGVKTWGLDRMTDLRVLDEKFRHLEEDSITRESGIALAFIPTTTRRSRKWCFPFRRWAGITMLRVPCMNRRRFWWITTKSTASACGLRLPGTLSSNCFPRATT